MFSANNAESRSEKENNKYIKAQGFIFQLSPHLTSPMRKYVRGRWIQRSA